MTTVNVTTQSSQKVVVTVHAPNTVTVYRKGDDGDSAYTVAVNNGFVGTEEEWLESLHNAVIYSGERTTGVDSGYLGQQSVTDEYLYVCVVAGAVGVAVWKKALLFQT
jgi:hypothetical protein